MDGYLFNNWSKLIDPVRIGATSLAWVNVSELLQNYYVDSDNSVQTKIGAVLDTLSATVHMTIADTEANATFNYASGYGMRYQTLTPNTQVIIPTQQIKYGDPVWILGQSADTEDIDAVLTTKSGTDNTVVTMTAPTSVVAGDIVLITGVTGLNGQYGVAAVLGSTVTLITEGYEKGFVAVTPPGAGAGKMMVCDKLVAARGRA